MKIARVLFFLACGILFTSVQNFAQKEAGQELNLYVGEIHILPVSGPSRIVVGNPAIADVSEVSRSEITISPKAPGTTSLVFWDSFGEQAYSIRVLAENLTDAKRRIDNILAKLSLPQVYTQIAEEEGKIFLLGRVKNDQEKDKITLALGPLAEKTTNLIEVKEEESVVEINVNLLELDKDSTKTLGFSWPGSITLSDSSGPVSTAVTGLKNVFHVSDFTRTAFDVTLDTLVQEGKAKVLSRPRLSCQSGKEAELLVGGEKPTFSTNVVQGGGSSTSIEYKEFGIKLKIRPTVTEEKKIKLAVSIEVSEVGAAEFIGSSNARTAQAYPLTKRNASTELIVNDGQTMAIGGLVKQKNEVDVRKTAFLGDVPILGALFRKTTDKMGGGQGERGNVELFITLTPSIAQKEAVAPAQPAAQNTAIEREEMALPVKDIPENFVSYARAVQSKINSAAYYPRQAQNAGWEGIVKLSLNINAAGQLKGVKILQPSGYKVLDDVAVNSAKAQAPYPPFPPQIDAQEIWVDVPIVYKNK